MTNITKHGDEVTVTSTVLDYSAFENTLNNVKKFINGLSMQEIGLIELSDFAQLIKVVGLDRYALYTVPEYAYMYTSLVEYFDEY